MTRLKAYWHSFLLALILSQAALTTEQPATAASFQWLEQGLGGKSSAASSVSDDGLTIVGNLFVGSVPDSTLAVKWNREGGMTFLGDLPGGLNQSVGIDVSADGSVIVGSSASALSALEHDSYEEPFYWTAERGMLGLGFLPGTNGHSGEAFAVSGNGLVVVGYSSGDSGVRAFRWASASGMLDLGELTDPPPPNVGHYTAVDVNFDGSVIIGDSVVLHVDDEGIAELDFESFRWTETEGMKSLGLLPGSDRTNAYAVSSDGDVIVGDSATPDGSRAFRWTSETGMVHLETGSMRTSAFGVSADGTIIVGGGDFGTHPFQQLAVAWDRYGRLHLIEDLLERAGVRDQLQGGHLLAASDISSDGQTIVGKGIGPSGRVQAWVATVTVPEPASFLPGLLSLAIVFRSRFRSWQ